MEQKEKKSNLLRLKKPQPVEEKPKVVRYSGDGLDAYSRHKKFINDYVIFYGKQAEYTAPTRPVKTDYDVLREEYRTEEDDDNSKFEKRMAKKYYDKLFKEYCLGDFTRYKHGQIGMRWRVEREVFAGKGQFICGNKTCNTRENLNSYEVNFAYVEGGEQKNALVKLRLCPPCAEMLNYYRQKNNKKRKEKEKKEEEEEEEEETEESDKVRKRHKKQKIKKENEEDKKDQEGGREEGEGEGEGEEEKGGLKNETISGNPWKKKAEVEKTKEDEFEDYFAGLFP